MTLTQTAFLVRRIIAISAILFILGTLSLIGYKIWYAYYLANLPPVEEKPDTKFGLLPPPDFPKGTVSTSNFSYSLDTKTGGLPKIGVDAGFEKIIKVYFITQVFASFLSSERSQTLAEKFGITQPAEILSETEYRFRESDKSLLVNLDNGNFSYTKEATLSARVAFDENRLVSNFKQTLANLGSLKNDLQNGRSKVIFLKNSEGKLIPSLNPQEAEAAQVSLWPSSIDQKMIFTPNFNKSLITAIVVNDTNTLDGYLSLNFTYYPIDLSTYATYPVKTAEKAFEDLKTGKGVVIIEPDKPQVSISSVYLGYYLSQNYSPYLQPIFIFEGPNFVAYISAINEQLQSQAIQN